jgi:hypothetical protein
MIAPATDERVLDKAMKRKREQFLDDTASTSDDTASTFPPLRIPKFEEYTPQIAAAAAELGINVTTLKAIPANSTEQQLVQRIQNDLDNNAPSHRNWSFIPQCETGGTMATGFFKCNVTDPRTKEQRMSNICIKVDHLPEHQGSPSCVINAVYRNQDNGKQETPMFFQKIFHTDTHTVMIMNWKPTELGWMDGFDTIQAAAMDTTHYLNDKYKRDRLMSDMVSLFSKMSKEMNHNDLKPENMMLKEEGVAFIDFTIGQIYTNGRTPAPRGGSLHYIHPFFLVNPKSDGSRC